MKRTLIQNAVIVNGKPRKGSVVIEDERIIEILDEGKEPTTLCDIIINAEGCYLLPGVIDTHVHFREPGLTHKADIFSESQAAAAGGVTSVMDMPNTNPQTTTLQAFNDKMKLFAEESLINYACYFGATNDNYTQFDDLDVNHTCGIKLFMGSSTGNMLVDKAESLRRIFQGTTLPIAAHCESQSIIQANTEKYLKEFSRKEDKEVLDLPLQYHPLIRSEEACFESSALAAELANKANARLHLLHVSTAKELSLLNNKKEARDKNITAEACVSHLLFTDNDYEQYGTRIKCNPAIKTVADRDALRDAVNKDLIDVISTDHAPHLLSEKEGGALKAMSGMPMIQFSLVSMLQLVDEGIFTIEKVIDKMCHTPAELFDVEQRGFIRKNYYADLVLVRPNSPWTVTPDCILSKCGWSPLEGKTFNWKVERTFVNGHTVYSSEKGIDTSYHGKELFFS
ncbi:dihydroorotase [Bacteroides sp. 214]|uniref:dihydroorotase n=1 Tax=Bacteroides sp. 214 TaxID=2302935 RepID=UPI0013D3EDC6|nr:dihydroorotase [Bacteroides sp. 214]NDW11918.1 dihydroorotase [Bacteroides sp. 214]